jgi:sulfur carrier protein ThiS
MRKQAATIRKRDIEYEVRSGMTLGSAMKKLGILPETVLATRKGEMIIEDEIIQEGDLIILIDVISGG